MTCAVRDFRALSECTRLRLREWLSTEDQNVGELSISRLRILGHGSCTYRSQRSLTEDCPRLAAVHRMKQGQLAKAIEQHAEKIKARRTGSSVGSGDDIPWALVDELGSPSKASMKIVCGIAGGVGPSLSFRLQARSSAQVCSLVRERIDRFLPSSPVS